MRSIITHVSRLIVTFARPLLITTLSWIAVGAASGQTWTQLAPTGGPPSARGGSGSAYDPATNQMIIFGGQDSLGNNNDVWTLTLGAQQQWTQVPIAGSRPAERLGPGAGYDSVNSRLIVFGGGLGHTSPCVNDVWVLSNANGVAGLPAWTQLSPSGTAPPPRWGASAIYAPASNTMTIFGGNNCFSTNYNDVWVLSNANGQGGTPVWTQLSPAGTAPSAGHTATAVYDPGSNRMIIYGLIANPDQVWVLTNANGLGGTPTWIQLSPLAVGPPKYDQATVYDPSSNSMIVFGGIDGTVFTNDTWVLSNANGLGGTPNWTQLSPSGALPSARCCMETTYDPATKRMVIFGGGSSTSEFNDTWILTFAPSTSVQISSISPPVGGNAGNVTARIFGNGFQSGATVKLAGVGPDIVGTNTSLTTAINTSVLGATFDLTGASLGVRDVVIANPDGTSATLPGGFTVEQGGAPQISVDIVGLDRIRIGRGQTFYLGVSNTGNVDGAPGLISLSVPTVVQYAEQSVSDLFVAGVTSGPEYEIPSSTISGNNILLFATAGVPSGGSQFVPVQLTLPVPGLAAASASTPLSSSSFTLTAAWQDDLANMTLDDFLGFEQIPFISFPTSGCPTCLSAYNAELMAYSNLAGPYRALQAARGDEIKVVSKTVVDLSLAAGAIVLTESAGLTALGGVALGTTAGLIGVCVDNIIEDQACVGNLKGYLVEVAKGARDCLAGTPTTGPSCLQQLGLPPGVSLPPSVAAKLQGLVRIVDIATIVVDAFTSGQDVIGAEKLAFGTFQQAVAPYRTARTAYRACLNPTTCSVPTLPPLPPAPPGTVSLGPITPVTSLDPNEKVGSRGAGQQQFITGATPLRYSVFFANQDAATAPAQTVSITDHLDTTNDIPATLSLGPISFGSQVLTPPPFQTSFSSMVDLRPSTNLLVAVNADLNKSSGLLTWTFQSLDPATNQPPTDPAAGFLPPGGEGSVFFTVMPKQGLPTNTQIQNQATIVFDVNAPISTPTWTNTLDNTPPTSRVNPLSATETAYSFPVQWSGSDIGSGIQDFTIYVSDNGGPFTAWLTNTAATAATYTGVGGHTYSFHSIARDLVGNVENGKSASEATTLVLVDTTPPVIVPQISGTLGNNGWYRSNVTVSWTVTDPESGIASSTGCAPTTLTTNTAGVTLTCSATNGAGLPSSVPLTIKIDATPPTVACGASPNVLWPPNNKLVPINVSVDVSDSLSEPAGFTLVSVTNNEPDSGQGDVQGFVTATASTSGELRATRLGSGTGRVYTFTYSGSDRAGNTASCTTTVTVPHDQGKN